MNTSKVLLAGLTIATLSAAPALFADDTDAQIKAREALQQKMNELNSQSGAVAAKPAPAKPAPAKPKPTPAAPAAAPKPAPAKPVVAEPAPAKPTSTPAPVVAPAPAKPVGKPTPTLTSVPVTKQDDVATPASEVSRRGSSKSSGEFSEVPPPSSLGGAAGSPLAAKTPTSVPPSAAGTFSAFTTSSAKPPRSGGYAPLPAPASPLNASKEAQLADLLSRYRADLITPEQYHTERAKIIAAP